MILSLIIKIELKTINCDSALNVSTVALDFVPSLTCQVESISVEAPPLLAWEAQGLFSF